MDLDVVFRLEEKLDDLLKQHQDLLNECRRLRMEKDAFLQERNRVRAELDRILTKLDVVERELS